jgi:NitT/TauT family transport system substrate-binding protein
MNEPSIGGSQLGRRQFLRVVAGLGLSAAGMALLDGCAGVPSAPGAAQNTLETTTLRVVESLAICISPQYLAEDFLKRDGFTNVEYVKESLGSLRAVAAGQADISMTFSAPLITQIDAGDPIVILGGVHSGCFELFGTDQIHGIGDLKGKTVAVRQLGSSQHIFLASMLAYVGVDPRTDITWVIHPPPTRAARAAREGHRSCGRQQYDRQTLVAILLLYAGREPRVHAEQPGCDQTSAARDSTGGR